MVRWQSAFRYAAYTVLLLLGSQWLAAAVAGLQQPAFGTDAAHGHDALALIGRAGGLGAAAASRFAIMVISLKLAAGIYLLSTVGLAAAQQIAHGAASDARRDRALLFAVCVIMLMAAPLLVAGHVMPGVVDDLTLAVIGITLAGLSQPDLAAEPSAPEAPLATR